ncbi:ABC transporter substrate-binding protein, partial [Methylobacterium platani]|uniref:Tgt2/MlaC family protein n=1 Tax=Methylobacterium platani TaxID=427683 RepID=UPI000B1FFA8B
GQPRWFRAPGGAAYDANGLPLAICGSLVDIQSEMEVKAGQEPRARQLGALIAAFGPYLTATYATRLSAASGSKFAIDPKSEARGSGRIVHVTVTDGSGDTSPVDYVLNADNKITDVYLQGTVSEAGTLRTGFSEPLQEGGADGLLAHLKTSTETMLAAPAPKAKP